MCGRDSFLKIEKMLVLLLRDYDFFGNCDSVDKTYAYLKIDNINWFLVLGTFCRSRLIADSWKCLILEFVALLSMLPTKH